MTVLGEALVARSGKIAWEHISLLWCRSYPKIGASSVTVKCLFCEWPRWVRSHIKVFFSLSIFSVCVLGKEAVIMSDGASEETEFSTYHPFLRLWVVSFATLHANSVCRRLFEHSALAHRHD